MIMDHEATSTLYTLHISDHTTSSEKLSFSMVAVLKISMVVVLKSFQSLAKFLEKLPPGSSVKSSTQNSSPTRRQAEVALKQL